MRTHKKLVYILSFHINNSSDMPPGIIDAKIIFQQHDGDEEIVMEKRCSVGSVKAMMDGIFKEIYLITTTHRH